MSHYFTNDEVKSNEREVSVKIYDTDLKFIVDNGVFSKRGLDFGTRTLLEHLDLKNINGEVLDFGCGYGPIGIYVALKTESNVDMVDVNERALSLAKRNVLLNEVEANVFQSDIYSNVSKEYDFIITNPPIRIGKRKLYNILFGAYDYLKEGGELWLVVNKNQGAKSVIEDLKEKYHVFVKGRHKGFYIIIAKKIKLSENC